MGRQIAGWVKVFAPSAYVGPELSYDNPSVILGRNSLSLSRPDLSSSAGPEVHLPLLNGSLLRNMIYEARSNLQFQLAGTFLGDIATQRGRPVADSGARSHPIISVNISIEFEKKKTLFKITGALGPMLPWTCRDSPPSDNGGTFDISFTLLDEDLPEVCGDFAASLISNRDCYIFGDWSAER